MMSVMSDKAAAATHCPVGGFWVAHLALSLLQSLLQLSSSFMERVCSYHRNHQKLQGIRKSFARTITSFAIALFGSSESFLFSGKNLIMDRPEDKVWQLVSRYPDGKRWSCPHCGNTYAGSAICEGVPEESREQACSYIPPQVLEKIGFARGQYLDNAAIQGMHNPTAGQNHPGVVDVHNPTAGHNHPGEVDVHNPTAGQNHPGEEPDTEWQHYFDFNNIDM